MALSNLRALTRSEEGEGNLPSSLVGRSDLGEGGGVVKLSPDREKLIPLEPMCYGEMWIGFRHPSPDPTILHFAKLFIDISPSRDSPVRDQWKEPAIGHVSSASLADEILESDY